MSPENTFPLKPLLCLLALGIAVFMVIAISKKQDEKREESKAAVTPEAPVVVPTPNKRPKVQAPVVSQPKEPTPPKTGSLVEGQDDEQVVAGRKILLLPDGAERTIQWLKLLERCNYEELVRMTEIPAQPELDAGRTELRRLAIKRIGAREEMAKHVEARAKFDGNEKVSSIQKMAWEEWSKSNPSAALTLWKKYNAEQAGTPAIKKIIAAISKGLIEAESSNREAAVAKLSDEEKALFFQVNTKPTSPGGKAAKPSEVTLPQPQSP